MSETPTPNIIHVGGWQGDEYSEHKGQLLIFEPQTRPFATLERALGGRPGVTLIKAAAGAREGEAVIHRVSPDHSSSLLEPGEIASRGFSLDGQETVPITTVDGAIRSRHLQGFDTLRIDTQGYELEVLKGASDTLLSLSRVEIELHDPTAYPGAASLEDVDRFMADHGFKIVSFDDAGSDDLADVIYERA